MMDRLALRCLWIFGFASLGLAAPDIQRLGPFGGDVRSLAVHPQLPDRFFLGTADGQIYRSEDGGVSWKRLVPGLGRRGLVVDNLTFDPGDPATLYAGTWDLSSDRGWLFRSRDGGENWEHLPLGEHQYAIRAVAVSPQNSALIALGISTGVLLSRDGGKSWERISRGYRSLYNVESLAFDPRHESTLYVGTWRLGWKTPDLGKSWQAIHQGMVFDSDLFSILVNPQNPDILYASACTGVYRSENAGQRWVRLQKGLPGEARRVRTLQLDPSQPRVLYAGTTVGLFVSRDGGDSWQKLFENLVVNAVAVSPSQILAGTEDAGVLRSTDGGRTFHPSNQGFVHRQIGSLRLAPGSPGRIYAGLVRDRSHGGFYYTTDGGGQWEPFNDGLEEQAGSLQQILPASRSSQVFLATSGGVYVGTPPQEAWRLLPSTADLLVRDLTFADPAEEKILVGTDRGVALLHWKEDRLTVLSLPSETTVHAVIADLQGHRRFWAASDEGLFLSRDGGESWTLAGGLPPGPVRTLARLGRLLFAGTRNGLYRSPDDGASWLRCQGVTPLEPSSVTAHPAFPERIFATDALTGHLYVSHDGGGNWRSLSLDQESRILRLLVLGPEELLAGTLTEGVYRIQLNPERGDR